MRRSALRLAVVLLALAACSDSPTVDHPTGEGQLALLNALTPNDQVTLTLDGQPLTAPTSGTRSSRPISAGAHQIAVSGTDLSLTMPVDFTMPTNGRRSVVIARTAGATLSLLVTPDTAALPPNDAAKIRLVHAADGVDPAIGWLRLQGAPRDSAAAFIFPFTRGTGENPEFPGYGVRPPGTYIVSATTLTGDLPLTETFLTVEAGQVWSVILSRTSSGGLEWRAVREH